MTIPEPNRRSLSQVEAALERVQESADAFSRAAAGDPVETVAKPAADHPRLVELLKLVRREDPHTNRDVWRHIGEWVRRCRASASAVILRASRSMKRLDHKLARSRVTLRRVRGRYAHTTRDAMDRILQRLPSRSHDTAGDFRDVRDGQGAIQNKPVDLDELGAELWKRALNKISQDVIKDQAIDWPAYFQGLGDLFTTTITNSRLSADQRALLIRQLIERIDRLESFWPVAKRQVTERAPVP
jgi:hypothetical protein